MITNEPTTLSELLSEYIGSKDVLSVDYKELEDNLSINDIEFSKVRGSVRLANKLVLTPQDFIEIKSKFLALQIP